MLGHEDLNDHDELRFDPALGLVSGTLRPRPDKSGQGEPVVAALAGKSTLNRLEHGLMNGTTRYCKISLDKALEQVFLDMIGHARRHAFAATFLLVMLVAATPAHAWCIWGFGQCPPSIVGEYALEGNPVARLTITPDKITSTIGPVSFSADYVVKSVDGNRVTIEVALPDGNVPLDVLVENDQIRIGTRNFLAGVWKRQAPKP